MRRAHCRLGITHTLRLDNCELINAVQGQKITRRMLVSARHERVQRALALLQNLPNMTGYIVRLVRS